MDTPDRRTVAFGLIYTVAFLAIMAILGLGLRVFLFVAFGGA